MNECGECPWGPTVKFKHLLGDPKKPSLPGSTSDKSNK